MILQNLVQRMYHRIHPPLGRIVKIHSNHIHLAAEFLGHGHVCSTRMFFHGLFPCERSDSGVLAYTHYACATGGGKGFLGVREAGTILIFPPDSISTS